MNEWLQYCKELINKVIIPIGAILAFISLVWGKLSGFPAEGILAAFIIIAAGIFWGYHIRIIRKKDDEIVSLRKRIKLAENPKQKSSQDVCGTYKVEGKNQIEKEAYSGVLQIEEHGELLSCTWKFGTTREGDAPKPINGTGLLVDNALAFTSDYTNKKRALLAQGLRSIRLAGII